MALATILIGVLVIIALVKFSLRPKNFPPGPQRLPLLGNVSLLLANEPFHKILQSLAKTYGPVTGFYVGPQPMISVSGQEAIKEALHNEDLNNRPSGAVLQNRTLGEKLGLVFTDGPVWQEQRRFTLRHLRDLGFGKTSIEDQMMDEIHDLINHIKELAQSDVNRVVEFNSMFSVSLINILWAIIGGKRFQRDDVVFKELVLDVERFTKSGNVGLILFPVPEFLVRNVPLIPKLLGIGSHLFEPLQKFINNNIDEHLATKSEGDAPRDFLDVYLDEMDKRSGSSDKGSSFARKQLVMAIQDLFAAGSDTSSNTIGFAILYLVRFPDIQRRLQAELDDICGDALPSLAHRPNLPYTEAFIMEVMRVGNVVPLGVPHSAAKDTTIRGFHIPKGSVIAINYESVFQDKTIWKDPENFRPERHLNADGKVIKSDVLIPFGLGKRACLGEPLARNTVFLFVTALAKTFEFKTVPGEALPSLEPIAGLTMGPRPFRASVALRNTLHTE